jgi:hypothetical protein
MIAAAQIKILNRTLGVTWRKLLLMTCLGVGLGLLLALTVPIHAS